MTKLTLNVGEFKALVAKAIKGSSVNANILMTQLMAIELKNNKLSLITTDYSNYLYVTKDKCAGDDFYAVVYAEKFAKLISKLTSENVELSVKTDDRGKADVLNIKANGNYTLELPYDENGELIKFPDPLSQITDDDSWVKTGTKLSTLRLIMTTAKASVLPADEQSSGSPYTGYYLGDKAVTTNTYSMCGIDIKMFDDPLLVPASTIELLDTIAPVYEDVNVQYNDTDIVFSTPSVVVYGKLMDNVEQFPVEAITALLDEPYPSTCKIDRNQLIQVLDRLNLFVDVMDDNSVDLNFTKNGISISSKSNSGAEIIPYIESNDFSEFICSTNIGMLISMLKSNHAPHLVVMYGKDTGLKIVDDNVRQIVPLADEEEE